MWVVMLTLQCLPETSQRASAQPACMGIKATEHDGMIESNCMVWDLSPILKLQDSGVGFM